MEYKITHVQRRDEWQSQYGAMVTYAISLEGQDGWVVLNQKVETPPPREGDTLTGMIETKQNKNGTEYKKFKKVNPKFDQPPQGGVPNDKLEYIIKMLEELTDRGPLEGAGPPPEEPKTPDYEDPFAGMGI